jgi:integrase
MAAARTLRPALRAATMETLIGLMACTGVRDSEAFALDRHDIDHANSLLRIRDSKYGKSREVLIHHTTMAALDAYLARRATGCAPAAIASACSSQAGAPGYRTRACTPPSTRSGAPPA